jgi:integrase
MLATLYNTGARVSEITALRVGDVLTERRHAITLHGKGRRQRAIPLWPATTRQLRDWLADNDLKRPGFFAAPMRVAVLG